MNMQARLYHLHDEAGTTALGAALARVLIPGLCLHLNGTLGAGKTALTRAILHAAGHTGRVKSPTYNLVEIYPLQLEGETISLFHFDLYRMQNPEEFMEAGFREHFDGHNICIVEWPEKGEPLLPAADLNLTLTLAGDGREVKLAALSVQGHQCLARLKFAPNL